MEAPESGGDFSVKKVLSTLPTWGLILHATQLGNHICLLSVGSLTSTEFARVNFETPTSSFPRTHVYVQEEDRHLKFMFS